MVAINREMHYFAIGRQQLQEQLVKLFPGARRQQGLCEIAGQGQIALHALAKAGRHNDAVAAMCGLGLLVFGGHSAV